MISLIAAVAKNRVIGNAKGLPWYLPADLKRFRKLTIGKPIIMGKKTYETIGKPLPGRKNIVLAREKEFKAPGCTVVNSPDEALRAAAGNKQVCCSRNKEIMVIGGGQVFRIFLPLADRMYLTLIEEEFEGDVYFPQFDPDAWREVGREEHEPDEKNSYSYTFVRLERKT